MHFTWSKLNDHGIRTLPRTNVSFLPKFDVYKQLASLLVDLAYRMDNISDFLKLFNNEEAYLVHFETSVGYELRNITRGLSALGCITILSRPRVNPFQCLVWRFSSRVFGQAFGGLEVVLLAVFIYFFQFMSW